MMKRHFATPACLAIATALFAAPAVAQAPASPAAPAAPAPATSAPVPSAPSSAAPSSAAPSSAAPATAAPMHPSHPHAAAAHGMTRAHRVERLQTALNANGATLTVDGKMGPKTRAALEAFQKAHGLKVTGRPDKATIAALKTPG